MTSTKRKFDDHSRDMSGPSLRHFKSESVKRWLDSWVSCGSYPGAMMSVVNSSGEELLFHNADLPPNSTVRPYKRDSIFRIYSMTKPITSVAALILMDRGLMKLSDPVNKWIPSFKNTRVYLSGPADAPITEPCDKDITILHLMTHTSGITYGILGLHPCDQILRSNVGPDSLNWYMNTELSVLCEKVAISPLMAQPGTTFLYGLNTDILGHIVELVSGMKLDVFLKREIFDPLGMVDTDFFVPPEKLHRLADCYDFTVGQHFKPSINLERDRAEKHVLLSGGGGLVSTLHDYSRFVLCLLNYGALGGRRIVSEASVRLMSQNHLPDGKNIVDMASDGFSESVGDGVGFGLGVSVVTNPVAARGGHFSGVGEYGWGGVASTYFSIDPVHRFAVLFFTQLIPSSSYPIRSQLKWITHWFMQEEEDDLDSKAKNGDVKQAKTK